MEHNRFMALMPFIVNDLVNLIVQEENISEKDAIRILYSSQLYSYLECEETKVWHYSTHMLYSLLVEELETGSISFPDV